MEILVHKYGGTSLATMDQIQQVARSTALTYGRGRSLVVVVSARGAETDRLLALAAQVGDAGSGREIDQLLATGECASAALLALALRRLGVDAVSLTGAQAGIRVTGRHGAGMITSIEPDPVRRRLDEGKVVVVAGFQGSNVRGDTVTLGRGGSDTTAVAVSAALRAASCEIYTDVRGVCTADPRLVETARILPVVDVAVMAEMAFAGAKVVHSRAVELAALRRIQLRVSGSLTCGPGTVIVERSDAPVLESVGAVVAVAHDPDVAWLQASCGAGAAGRDGSDLAAEIFAALAGCSVPVDQVARSADDRDGCRVGLTVSRSDLAEVRAALDALVATHDGELRVRDDVAKVSLIGMGLLNRPEYAALLTAALAGAGITVGWMSTSQTRMSVLVPRHQQGRAVRVLHRAFALESLHGAHAYHGQEGETDDGPSLRSALR
ncbi:aspartate kinase [Plantactinospora alkalitolerans]|uniref:aspartate kinase n=1 Tax=Plantactinospora alkalitolerans TaxID=2789879 RepID=UPI002B1F286F|nr:aspartate kinase [Plantactinospora alkalitolerans]